MSFFDSLDRFVSDLQKNLKPEEVVKLRSCKKCSYYRKGYCTQTPVPTKILSEYYAQGCLFYSPQEAVVPTPRKIEIGEQIQLSGLNWFDRNPKSIGSKTSSFEWTPHGWVTRTSYTCPKDRIAMIEVMFISVMRLTTATNVGRAACDISWFDYAEDVWKFISRIEILDNTVGAREQWGLGSSATFYAGDMFEIQTQDVSTGGTCVYICNWKGTEFDA